PVVMFTTWLLATSLGWAFEAQGSSAMPSPGAVKRAADKIAANTVVLSSPSLGLSAAHRNPFSGRRTTFTHTTRPTCLAVAVIPALCLAYAISCRGWRFFRFTLGYASSRPGVYLFWDTSSSISADAVCHQPVKSRTRVRYKNI